MNLQVIDFKEVVKTVLKEKKLYLNQHDIKSIKSRSWRKGGRK